MDVRVWTHGEPAATDLARALAFQLGPITVDPPARRVSAGEGSAMLEPRVMRVLVALGEAPGRVLTRDDLIELCWDGQIVSDNAINRVISLLRRALEDLGGTAVRLETITKVGFRIVVEPGAAEAEPSAEAPPAEPGFAGAAPLEAKPGPVRPREGSIPFRHREWTRRAVVGGIAASGIAGTAFAYAAWNRAARHVPDPRALDLYQRGQLTQKTGLPGTMRQAMSFYEQAVAIDPEYADAWAALAIGYRHGGDGFVKEPRSAYPRLVRSAAGRALALDPDNAEAHLALAVIDSDFGRWLEQEQRLRSIARRFPNYWFTFAQLDLLLQNVGRFEEAIIFRKRFLELEPMVPAGWAQLARGLHYAGRDHEADIALDEGFSRWPANPFLWFMRYSILVGGKRYTEAAAFARDPRYLPEMYPKELAEARARIADALASKRGNEQIQAMLGQAPLKPLNLDLLPFTLPVLAELGATAMVLELLEIYFFGGVLNEQVVPPPEAQDARVTAVLFAPAVLAFRDHPQYASLLERTGLEDYWRKSGAQPDFRRADRPPSSSGAADNPA